MEYLLVCTKCKYEVKILDTEIYSTPTCSLCGGSMVCKEFKETNKDIYEITDEYIIERVKGQIELMGNDRCWNGIEAIGKAQTRIQYRKYFFLAGGKMPESNKT
jgi:hypothetical protein